MGSVVNDSWTPPIVRFISVSLLESSGFSVDSIMCNAMQNGKSALSPEPFFSTLEPIENLHFWQPVSEETKLMN